MKFLDTKAGKFFMNALVFAMFFAIPFGLGMAFYTDNPKWLWLCAFLFIFLS